MEPIQISVRLPKSQVLPGERFLARTAIRNTGAGAVTVPDFDSPTKLVYELIPESPLRRRYRVSYEMLRRELGGMPEEAEPAPEMTLDAGHWLTREEDLAGLTIDPFAPGGYQLIARFQHDGEAGPVSDPVAVRIAEPQIALFTLHISRPEQVARHAFLHRGGDGLTLLERESRPDPRRGVFFRRREFPADASIGDLAVSVDAEQIVGGHWYAWLEADRLVMERSWGSSVERTVPVTLGLAGARLAHPGLQLADTAGWFLAAGMAEGECAVEAWQAQQDSGKRLWRQRLGTAGVPDHLAAWYHDGSVTLVWLEGPAELRARSFTLDGRAGENAPRALASFDDPVAAWEAGPEVRVVTAGSSGGAVAAHRVPLTGEQARTATLPAKEKLRVLATMTPQDDRFPVLAQIDDRLALAWAGAGSGWTDLGPIRWPGGRWVLFAPGRAIWAGCASAEAGFVCKRLGGGPR